MVINSMELDDYITGSAQPKLSQDNLNKIPLPLPPLQEQKRIIKSIDYWFSFVDCIEASKDSLQETIKQTKSKILDLAIHGKLVPQDQTDEPASQLLKRINPKAEIACDNAQYGKLPKGWCEVQLGDIFNHNTGKALNASNTGGTMRKYLTTSNVYWNTFDFTTVKQMHYKDCELDKCSITKVICLFVRAVMSAGLLFGISTTIFAYKTTFIDCVQNLQFYVYHCTIMYSTILKKII